MKWESSGACSHMNSCPRKEWVAGRTVLRYSRVTDERNTPPEYECYNAWKLRDDAIVQFARVFRTTGEAELYLAQDNARNQGIRDQYPAKCGCPGTPHDVHPVPVQLRPENSWQVIWQGEES